MIDTPSKKGENQFRRWFLSHHPLEALMTSNSHPPPLRTGFFRSIQGKLVLLLLTLVIPNILILLYMHYDRLQARRVEEFQANLEIGRAVAKNFETFFRDIVIDELLIGAALSSSQPMSNLEQNRLLTRARTMRSTIWHLFWVNPTGRVLAATDPESVGIDLTDRSYFREIQAGRDIVVSDLILSKRTERPTFTISRGIRNEGGDLIGIVIAAIAPDELEGVMGIERSSDASVSILDSKGMLVYQSPKANYTWEQRNRLERVPVPEDALKSKEIVTTITSAPTGKRRLAAFVPIPSIGWVATASRPEEVVMQAVIYKILPAAGLRLFITIVALSIALVFIRRLSTSIGKLRDRALAVGRGESHAPMTRPGTVELDELADAFNKMTEDLQSRQMERKQAEEALQASEEKFRLAFRTSPDSISVNRLHDGMYLDINEGFTKATGYSSEDVIGKTSIELNIWDDPKDRERMVATLQHEGFIENLEAGFRRKDGRI